MRIFLSLYCILVLATVSAQTEQKKSGNESYYVLTSDKKIKQGEYILKYKKQIIEKGQYDNNVRSGIWEFYDNDGKLEQKYDYTNRTLIFDSGYPSPFSSFDVVVNDQLTGTTPDTVPLFIGGASRYKRFLAENLKYPSYAKRMGTEGRLRSIVIVTKEGQVTGAVIAAGISKDLDEEGLRLLGLFSNELIPGQKNGEAVDVKMVVMVEFKLKDL